MFKRQKTETEPFVVSIPLPKGVLICKKATFKFDSSEFTTLWSQLDYSNTGLTDSDLKPILLAAEMNLRIEPV